MTAIDLLFETLQKLQYTGAIFYKGLTQNIADYGHFQCDDDKIITNMCK